ncbi:hypothetical protein LAZ67_7003536 [Cordylochernes scorpioides]|uniref:RNA-directed DNA polymerase n=1 Tax=Cordylochernes scorpioides TaxID=51811 RepID=A0ABY6KNW4_9ARAC|nr:hypothetical protein LAZ67_7003536 [Cordylochernes scorpioides]
MDRKKVCKKSSAKKKMMSIELKPEIIEIHEQGVRVVDLSRQYGHSTSMICSVLKRKESIKSVTPAKGLTIISKLRTSLHENMEKLLMVWVTENQLQGDTLTQTIICEKARAIYRDLLKQTPQTSIDEALEESFKASRGWMVETRSGKMQDPAQERIKAEESVKPQPGATIGRDASSDPVVLNPNIDIPKYDGTEDPRPWIESLEEIGFLYHWADYIISRYAAMNMIGSAKTWLNLHKVSFTSWENFKSRLIEDFASDANKEEMRIRLNRIQQWNEPAIRFAEDILVLCNKVDPQMEEETKINWVIGGLKKEYSFALHLNPPKNTNELLEICKKLDLFEKNYQERAEKSKALYNGPRSPRPHHQEQWKNATSFRRPYQNTSKPQAPAPRYYQNTSKPQAPTPRYYQNKPLPQVSAPRRSYTPNPEPKPVYPSKIYNKNPNSNRNRTEDGRPICFKCNKPGHVARYCRVRFVRIVEEDPIVTQDKVEEEIRMDNGTQKSRPLLYSDNFIKLINAFVEVEDGEYIIEENHKMFQTNGLRLARSLINVVNKETYIWITNPYPRPLKILKNQTLCFGSQPAEVNLMEESEQKEHEEPQFQINENLAYTEKEQLKQVLERYEDLFSSGLGRSNLAKHRIDTEGAKPIKHKPYRVSAKEREIIKEQIDEMLRDGIIRPSSSPWSFPVILVKKRDGKYRFCVDYRKLNDVTVKDVYPIPRIDEVLDTLQGSKYFSAIDLKSGYWQVEVEEKDKEKTAFTTAHGLYEFNVMPFGLCNAPATFERNMENMLGNLRWQICLCYLDDVIIYSSDFSTHLKRIEAVLKCFREANLKLNNKKCQFAFEELEILGHITNQHGIKPAEHNIKAIRDFPRPKKIKEVQSFLGMCSYYRKFIKGFSKIADPLTSLIKKNVPFTWTENQEKAFQTLKVALINPPILGHFDPNAITYIHTDASNIGLGATLVQKFGDKEKVISYLSRTLSKPEQNYSTTEKECLAVVWSMSKLRPYLYGRHFKIVTDHHALCWLKNLKDPTGRLARWALKIQEYNFEIIHKSGKKHLDADGLSRGPLPENEWDEDYERLFLNQIIDEKDDFIENIMENLSGNKRSITQNFKEENGCLYKKNPNPEGRAWLLVVPKKRRKEVMSEYHNHMLNGHLGVARTTYRLKNKYYWPSMLKDVSEFVKTCHLCQSRKGSNHLPSGLLQPIPPANYPFERIGIDFVGPLPSTKRRRKWIIVLTDYYTKYAETKAVSEATVKEVSTFLIEHIILRHGAPRFLISDRGSQFTSNLMKEVMKMCKVKHCFTTSYHPQTNGLTERLNRTLINMISMYVNTDQKNWDEILPFITHAYNTTIQETTGYSPFFLLFGREPMSLLDDENIPTDSNMDDYDEYIENYLDKIQGRDRNYDKKHNEKIYEPGHLVAVWTPVRKIGKCEKLLRKYFGPYRILKKLSNVNYLIEPKDNPGQDPLIVHVSRLKPYFERINETDFNSTPTLTQLKALIPWGIELKMVDYRGKFWQLRKGREQSVKEYYFAKMKIATKLGLSQELILEGLTSGIDSECERLLIAASPASLERWLEIAEALEVILPDNDILGVVATQTSKPDDDSLLPGKEDRAIGSGTGEREGTIITGSTFRQRGAKPRALPPFRITRLERLGFNKQQIEQLLKYGLIKPASSPYSAPVTLAPKKGEGRVRLCIDYRLLNRKIISDSFPIPLLEDIVQKVQGARVFSCLDILSAYWTIPLHPKDREVTCFSTSEGSYVWCRLPFGLKTALAIFNRKLSAILQKYRLDNDDLDFNYNKGCENHEADMLSRLPYSYFLAAQAMKQNQGDLSIPPSKLYSMVDGITYIRLNNKDRIVVPLELQDNLIQKAHESLGHPGISAMIRALSVQYYFKGMIVKIKNYVKNCKECQTIKSITQPSYGLMGSLPRATKPFDVVASDTVLGLGGYNSAKYCIHTVIDHHSRYIWGYASKGTSIVTYINIINQLLNIGKPRILVTDRHPSFVSKRFNKFLQEKGIKHLMTAPSHPKCNGLLERANATLIGKLKIQHQEYRNTPHSTTTFPLIYLLYGTLPSYISDLTNPYLPVEKARTIANEKTEELHKRLVKRYNSSHRFPNLKIGDKVLYRIPHQVGHGKLSPVYYPDPYTVLSTPSPHIVEINKPCQPENKPSTIVNVSKLKLWDPISTSNEGMGNYPFPFQDVEDLNECL